MEAGVETAEADGATSTEAVPTEAVAKGTRVVLLAATGYGATGIALLSGTTEAAGAVLRMTAGVEEFATMTGADETIGVTIGVTIGATGVEETATGVALVAMTGWVKVQGHSVTVNVVACKGNFCQPMRTDECVCNHAKEALAYLGDSVDLAIDGQGGGRWTIGGQSADDLCCIGGRVFFRGNAGREGNGSKNDRVTHFDGW